MRKYEEMVEEGRGSKVQESKGPRVLRTKISESHIQMRA